MKNFNILLLIITIFISCTKEKPIPKASQAAVTETTNHNSKFLETINQKSQFEVLGTANFNWSLINFTDIKFNDFYFDQVTNKINFAYNQATIAGLDPIYQYVGYSNSINPVTKNTDLPISNINFRLDNNSINQSLFYTQKTNKLVYYLQDTNLVEFKIGINETASRKNRNAWRFTKTEQLIQYNTNEIQVGNKHMVFNNIDKYNLFGFYEPLANNKDSGIFISISREAISVYSVSVNNVNAKLLSTSNFKSPITSSLNTNLRFRYSADGTKLIGSFMLDVINQPSVHTFIINTQTNNVTQVLEGISLNGKYESSVPYSDLDDNGNFYFMGNGTTYLYKNVYKVTPNTIENLGLNDAIKITLAPNRITHQNKIVGFKNINNHIYIVIQSRITPLVKTGVESENQILSQFLFLKLK